MKRIIVHLSVIAFLLLGLPLLAQPPEPGGEPGSAPPLGGSAPLDGGVSVMLVLAAAYAAKMTHSYSHRKDGTMK